MEYRLLGRSGLKVSELCLGAMYFGGPSDEETSFEILDEFADQGGNFIDTAKGYTEGRSEEVLGRWLARRDRDDFVIATKLLGRWTGGPANTGLSRKNILSSVDASLSRLGTDYIDLYYTHAWDETTPIAETLSALSDLVTAGKIRYIGASNLAGWQLQKALDLSERNGWARYVALQPLYNLLDREIEWDSLQVCLAEGLGVLPWSPLRAGWLSGKFKRDAPRPQSSRVQDSSDIPFDMSWEQYNNERTWTILDAVEKVAAETGRSVPQVAIRWLMQQPGVTAPIIGPRTIEQVCSSLGASGWSLSDEHQDLLAQVSTQPKPYPFNLLDYFAAGRG
ncbi:aldo/keto reductase [Actinopolymorpha sp. B11F2]|uniref:aldo/keto reductase n=1 Tax=Actinopolymorpha sp. B11F2 TaxID=3160862 RepID=UPI0032E43E47